MKLIRTDSSRNSRSACASAVPLLITALLTRVVLDLPLSSVLWPLLLAWSPLTELSVWLLEDSSVLLSHDNFLCHKTFVSKKFFTYSKIFYKGVVLILVSDLCSSLVSTNIFPSCITIYVQN